jgi:hypothetical protein
LTAQAVSDVIERVMRDAAFRDRLAADPSTALAEFDLTPEERAAFGGGKLAAERLEPRISKTDLSAGMSAKTSSPMVPQRRPPQGSEPR